MGSGHRDNSGVGALATERVSEVRNLLVDAVFKQPITFLIIGIFDRVCTKRKRRLGRLK